MSKITSISPLIQKLKKSNINAYNYLQNLNKRIQSQIDSALRNSIIEVFDLGYYINGGDCSCINNISKFTSPIDGYIYHQSQIEYFWSLYSTRPADTTNPDGTTFVNGQLNFPQPSSTAGGPGTLLACTFSVDPNSGAVYMLTQYWDGTTQTDSSDGLIKVSAQCSRVKS